MKKFCMLNGALIPENEASLRINDLSIRRGYGIFDCFRVQNGRPLYLDRHMRRFLNGARATRMDSGFLSNELTDQVLALIQAHEDIPEHAIIRMLLTGGYSSWEPESPNLMITFEDLKEYAAHFYTEGARVISYPYLRELPEIKTISYMTAVYLTPRMREASAIEVLYHQNGFVNEFSRSSVFAIRNGTLFTPNEHILPGITRSVILEIAREQMPVQEVPLTFDKVLRSDEVFMASTIKRIIPVVQIDQNRISDGRPGGVTRTLMQLLKKRDEQEASVRASREA